jgi:hypothetical protein
VRAYFAKKHFFHFTRNMNVPKQVVDRSRFTYMHNGSHNATGCQILNIDTHKTFGNLQDASKEPQQYLMVLFKDTKCVEFVIGYLIRANNGQVTLSPAGSPTLMKRMKDIGIDTASEWEYRVWEDFNCINNPSSTKLADRIVSDWYLYQKLSEKPRIAKEPYMATMSTFLAELVRRCDAIANSSVVANPESTPSGPDMMRINAGPEQHVAEVLDMEVASALLQVDEPVEEQPKKRKAEDVQPQPSKRQETSKLEDFLVRAYEDLKEQYGLRKEVMRAKGPDQYRWKEPVSLAFLTKEDAQCTDENKRSVLLVTAALAIQHQSRPLNTENPRAPDLTWESIDGVPSHKDISPRKAKKIVDSIQQKATEWQQNYAAWDLARKQVSNGVRVLLQLAPMTPQAWCTRLAGETALLPLVLTRLSNFHAIEFAGLSWPECARIPTPKTGAALLVLYHDSMNPYDPNDADEFLN